MKRKNFITAISVFFMFIFFVLNVFGQDNVKIMLEDGKKFIENGKYEEAVNCLGKILAELGDKTNDPKVVAFGATVQAYGILEMHNASMNATVKQYLQKAIQNDPDWKYPKELFERVK